ncbi:MAG: hypothetical protein ACLQVF_15680 [Isosphaeraceae bacterium]
MPSNIPHDWPSDRMALATGLFARLANAIDHGRFTEAANVRAQLSQLGFDVTITPDKTRRVGVRKAVKP